MAYFYSQHDVEAKVFFKLEGDVFVEVDLRTKLLPSLMHRFQGHLLSKKLTKPDS